MSAPTPKKVANVLLNDFMGILKKHKVTVENCGISPEDFGDLIKLYELEIIDKKKVREILENRVIKHKEEQES